MYLKDKNLTSSDSNIANEEHLQDLNKAFSHLPDYEDFSSSTLVHFQTYQNPNAKVLWVNTRWMFEAGIDIQISSVRDKVHDWLLANFGVLVPYPNAQPCPHYSSTEITFGADRYGSILGNTHGGSGRCGTHKGFNAKGIGRTPLVSNEVDWGHSHGCFWLEEAIRETIVSEITSAEVPTGSIPVVAIINAGVRFHFDDGTLGEHRAIVVRPNFIRIAHLQRSIFFGTSGTRQSDQFHDAIRVREGLQALWGNKHKRQKLGVKSESLLQSALLTAEQLGFCQFHRLSPGPFYASNSTIDGELVDFGSFRSLPSWKKYIFAPSKPKFGEEMRDINATYIALMRSLKLNNIQCPDVNKLVSATSSRFRRIFEAECRNAINIHSIDGQPTVQKIIKILTDLFEKEQKNSEQELHYKNELAYLAGGFLADFLLGGKVNGCVTSDAEQAAHQIRQELQVLYKASSYPANIDCVISLMAMCRIFLHRDLLERERLISRNERFIKKAFHYGQLDYSLVENYIKSVVGRSRRIWKDLPHDTIVMAQQTDLYSSVLICLNPKTNQYFVWVEAIKVANTIKVFAQNIPVDRVSVRNFSSNSQWVRFAINVECIEAFRGHQNVEVTLNGFLLRLPKMRLWYRLIDSNYFSGYI